jgi:hypothetical protein
VLSLALLLPSIAGAGAAAGAGTFNSVEEFARAVGMKKGGWHTRVKVTEAEIKPSPAADPAYLAQVRARIESQIGVVQEKDECSVNSPQGRPRLPGILLEPKCAYSRLQAADGLWALSCAISTTDEIGTAQSEGTYSRKKVTGRHEGVITHEGVVIHLTAETESRYVGECSAPKPFDTILEGD